MCTSNFALNAGTETSAPIHSTPDCRLQIPTIPRTIQTFAPRGLNEGLIIRINLPRSWIYTKSKSIAGQDVLFDALTRSVRTELNYATRKEFKEVHSSGQLSDSNYTEEIGPFKTWKMNHPGHKTCSVKGCNAGWVPHWWQVTKSGGKEIADFLSLGLLNREMKPKIK